MKAIDKFKDYSKTLETAKIYVPEMDLDIYVEPITLAQRSDLIRRTVDMDEIKTAIEAVVTLAKDESGEPAFTLEDKPILMRLGGTGDITIRLCHQIMNAHVVSDPLPLSEETN